MPDKHEVGGSSPLGPTIRAKLVSEELRVKSEELRGEIFIR